ncbi:MAG TPA: hypothetical protein DDW33_03645 [Ktedonobacter sp.]|nr:hypothetical protein [Ktedonobacter sp.]HCF86123.1 hypothetical protein [Ktedonobacter sp.]
MGDSFAPSLAYNRASPNRSKTPRDAQRDEYFSHQSNTLSTYLLGERVKACGAVSFEERGLVENERKIYE